MLFSDLASDLKYFDVPVMESTICYATASVISVKARRKAVKYLSYAS
jgi:hypothetical protein